MVICETDRLILRDFQKDDIEKRIEWWTRDCEWQDWDAPWEKEELTEDDGSFQEFVDGLGKKLLPDTCGSFDM